MTIFVEQYLTVPIGIIPSYGKHFINLMLNNVWCILF